MAAGTGCVDKRPIDLVVMRRVKKSRAMETGVVTEELENGRGGSLLGKGSGIREL